MIVTDFTYRTKKKKKKKNQSAMDFIQNRRVFMRYGRGCDSKYASWWVEKDWVKKKNENKKKTTDG